MRYRGWKTKRAREKDNLAHLIDFLEKSRTPYSRNVHVRLLSTKQKMPDGTEQWVSRPVKLRESQKGMPDVFVFLPAPHMLAVETKASDGKQSDEQKRWQRILESCGYRYFLPSTPKEIHELCDLIMEITVKTL